uniref:Isopropylmalate dehydrogenase-like domain-containing protein n=1 Tax=Erythrolobus madagascarensis TaxID=708628 RepID=A0A7S0T8F3_9RHOD
MQVAEAGRRTARCAIRALASAQKKWYSSSLPSIASSTGVEPKFNFFPSAQSLKVQRATLIPGQGIGKEATDAMVEVFDAAEAPVAWERFELDDSDEVLADNVKQSFASNGVAVKGPFFSPVGSPKRSMNVVLRTELDLFCNVVHVFNFEGLETRHKNVDTVVIRENTEGEYSGLEHEVVPGVVESLKIISAEKSTRIAEYAFKYAVMNGRKKVTAVHKANIMKAADGLFLKCCADVAKKYPGIEFEGMIVDNACMQMTSKPQQFDVIVLPNLYGNIVTNLATGLVGGPGLFPGMNIGASGAMFEQGARHAATQLAGRNVANPTATILSGCMMLRYLKLNHEADRISNAVMAMYKDGGKEYLTPDVGGSGSTSEFVKAITTRLNYD